MPPGLFLFLSTTTSSFMLTLHLSLKCQPLYGSNQSHDLVVSTNVPSVATLVPPLAKLKSPRRKPFPPGLATFVGIKTSVALIVCPAAKVAGEALLVTKYVNQIVEFVSLGIPVIVPGA